MGILRFPRRRSVLNDDPEPATELADEVEAYLNGDLAEYRAHNGQGVPPWAMLNRLAHGTLEQTAALSATGGPGWHLHPALGAWEAAERSIAQRITAACATAGELRRVQAGVLVPLESVLMERSRITTLTPASVLRATTAALDARPFGV